MGIENADQPANAGEQTNTDSNGSANAEAAKAAEEKLLPQSQVNAIVAREKAAMARQSETLTKELEATRAQLAEVAEKERKAEEAKLSATERADRERRRIEETNAKALADATQRADTAERRRVQSVRTQHAARLAAGIAKDLSSPDLIEDVTERIAARIVVEDDGKGGDRVMFQMGDAEGDTEPLESGFTKFKADSKLTRYFRQATGSGGQHGAGGAGGRASFAHLSPTDKIAAGLEAQKRGR